MSPTAAAATERRSELPSPPPPTAPESPSAERFASRLPPPTPRWWDNLRSTTNRATTMETAATNWGAVALGICIAAGLVWGLLFFLRQNRQDLESLEQTLRADSDESEDGPPGPA
jgi:hypothetical protein